MKILIVRTYPTLMKLDTYNSQELGLAKAYLDAGHECDIVYFHGFKETTTQFLEYKNKKITIFWMKSLKILNNGFFFGLKKLLKQYDFYQVSEYDQMTSHYIYSHFPDKTYVYQGVYDSDISRIHNIKDWFFDHLILRNKERKNTLVFTKSELASQSLLGKGFKKIKTIGVGMDFSRFNSYSDCGVETQNRIVYIGKLEDRRNILFLLETFSCFYSLHKDYKLILVGDGSSKYVKIVEEKIDELHIRNAVQRIKKMNQEELPSLYASAKMFLLPTKYEIFGMVLLEAMFFGVPVITSYNGGSSTLIPNANYGYVIEKFQINDWVEAMNSIVERREFVSSITLNAHENVVTNYSWNAICGHILSYLEVE